MQGKPVQSKPISPETAAGDLPVTSQAAGPGMVRIGCVSYLNSKPLIEGIDSNQAAYRYPVRFDVPSRLLDDLEQGTVELALCPVIDYFTSAAPLEIVPVGGIASQGRTLTVRLYSRVAIEKIQTIYADTDSHTSTILLRVLMRELFQRTPTITDYHAREQVAGHKLIDKPQAMLLIGDKVVTDSPQAAVYPYQLDLGEAWHRLTGLPFVFAIWMCRQGAALGDLPAHLREQRLRNEQRLGEIAAKHAPAHQWPIDVAQQYLAELLHYRIGPDEIRAIDRFAQMALAAGLIDEVRPLHLRKT